MPKAVEYIQGSQLLYACKVLSCSEVAPGKFTVRFERLFPSKAGHVVAIALNKSHEPRIYSLCCGETDEAMQILFDVKDDGILTPQLANVKHGDSLLVSKPYGSFLPSSQPMWWIATGTGIAPFYAMLRSGYKPECLLHGVKQGLHFYFENEFKQSLHEKYLRCNSGNDGYGDYPGRVTHYLEALTHLPEHNKYYLCGRALMVVEVRDMLISKGVPYGNIISEIFF